MVTVTQAKIIQLPKIEDRRGSLSVIEAKKHIPFSIHRAYTIYNVPIGGIRGDHAYKELQEFVVALSGSVDIVLDDGKEKKLFTLNLPHAGLYVPNMIWRRLENFSANSVVLIMASQPYNEKDYLRDYTAFKDINLA
jgi:dTDP-4-dehydrorhamnose 3,5-epimerase-like enzyme